MRSCFDPTVEVTYDAKDARLCYKKLKKNIESMDCDGYSIKLLSKENTLTVNDWFNLGVPFNGGLT
jgi:hypothetical protein